MKRTIFQAILGLCLTGAAGNAAAQAITVKRATVQSEVSTSHPEHGHADRRAEIVWNSATPPSEIYYRPDAAHWLNCKAIRQERRPFGGGPNDYMVMDNHAPLKTFKKGEALILRPEAMPSDMQPDEVKKLATGALFYKLEGSGKWITQKITFKKLPDLRVP